MRLSIRVLLSFVALAVCAPAALAQWHPQTVLNTAADWNGGANAIKGGKITPLAGGGVGAVYVSGSKKLVYRTYSSTGVLGPATTVATASGSNLIFNPDVAQTGDGTIATVWENWVGAPSAGFSQSTNGGSTFSAPITVSGSTTGVKWPQITRQGTANDNASMVTYLQSGGSAGATGPIRYNFNNNGAGFTGDTALGNNGNNEYTAQFDPQAYGKDGSVWRFWGETNGGTYSIRYRRFDPISELWSSAQTAVSGLTSFISRLSAAVADNGKVMITWDMNNGTWASTRDTGGAWGNATQYINRPFFGSVAARPGTNDFYIFSSYGQDFPVMNPVLDGIHDMPMEYPGTAISNTFIPFVSGTIDENGKAYITWEHWANDGGQNPQYMIAYRDALPVPEPSTIALLGMGVAALGYARYRRRTVK